MGIYAIQPVFSRGEISPKLHSRADLELYKTGLKELLNFLVMRQGGVCRRPGTKFVMEVKDSSRPARAIPFIYHSGATYVAYVLVFNAGVFRVYALDGRVGTVEVSHPYADSDLFGIDFDQTNDVLDLTHKSYAPMRITRSSDTSWAIATVPFRFGPYLDVNVTATTLTPSGGGGSADGTGNPIPKMTSNTAPSGTCAASSVLSSSAFNGFDRDSGAFWYSSGKASEWLSYTFPSSKIIVGYSVQAGTGTVGGGDLLTTRAPKSWTFEGFDGTNWIVLDSQYGQTAWSDGEARYFRFINTTAYIGYRINMSSNNGGATYAIAELAFTESLTTAPAVTITASSVTGINGGAGFTNADIGRIVSILGANAIYRAFVITAVTSTTVVSAVLDDAPLQIAQTTLQWRLGAWGATPGWPAHICTFEGRKVYARTNAQPSGIWGTRSNGYGSFLDYSVTVPVADDDAITFTLADVNEIQWLSEGMDMGIGTGGAARTMGRDSPNLAFSAKNFRQVLQSSYGSQAVRPTKVGKSTVFVSVYGKALREFAGDNSNSGYDTPDISVMSEHLLSSGVVEVTYQQEPNSIVWSVAGNGELVGLTYEKQQNMAGFHHHQLGGVFGTGIPIVESACTIPGTGQNETWLIVKRTINGGTKRYIERLTQPFDSKTGVPANAWYVDCGLQYNSTPAITISGLGHLEGQTVSVLADGARQQDKVVSSGAIALDIAASNVIVGLPYTSRLRTLPSAVSQGDGSGLGRRKKISRVIFDMVDCGPVRVGRHVSTAEQAVFRHTTDNLGAAPPLNSGFVEAHPGTSWSDNGELVVIADGPQPATILSITPSIDSEP